ncbi:hypothetical protein PN416_17660 [Halorubrum ezzemoulense]|uniref:hypothetical protein n=1 Tax=Halorubrum ezzemoulense TaxID=337243 RepID=UPI0023300BE6|nr:hypothetical protein [Halorubrum ezzemoulense]MDB9281717.1 hypothetical protein [Halorubrum ezzemoulense]MDB9285210.1 hypothetical protein [Halorubrum ezzemoulense]
MSLITDAIHIAQTEGFGKLINKSKNYLANKHSPRPTVSNGTTPLPFWYLKYLYNVWFNVKYGSGVDVLDEDWDTLILLDACRYDDFEEFNEISGDLSSRISKGVDSDKFIRRNLVGRDLSDTVYVTANPHVRLISNDTFYEIITEPISNWDSELQCVRPTQVTSSAIEAHRQYPDKRIIVHYMQPHDPPLGPTASELRKEFEIGGASPERNSRRGERIMELVASGEIPEEKARRAYRETLEIVLDEVSSLLVQVDGKIVISADHGEMFGEQPYPILGKLYEHYQNPRTTELCKVPWFVVDSQGDRRKIHSGNSKEDTADINGDMLSDQLEALGYK